MAKKVKSKKLLDTILKRGCKSCPRWHAIAKKIYEDSGELCAIEGCVGVSKYTPQTKLQPLSVWNIAPHQASTDTVTTYDDNEVLNEKLEDSPASLVTRTSTKREP